VKAAGPGRRRIRWLHAALGTLVLSATEVALRLASFSYARPDLPIHVWNADQDPELARETGLHRTSPRQLWEPRPGALVLAGSDERVNAAGWRGPLVPREKRPGVLRVAMMGDSSVFGVCTKWEDTFTGRLGGLLERAGVPNEVLDFGVMGHSSRAGLERYRDLVRSWKPDVVVAGYGAINDHFASILSDAQKIARNDELARGPERARRLLLANVRLAQLCAWAADELTGREERFQRAWAEEVERQLAGGTRVGQPGFTGVRRVSPGEFEGVMTTFVHEIRADGARPILISMPRTAKEEDERPILLEYTRRLESVAEREGVALADVRALFSNPPEGLEPAQLFVEGDPVHPSALGHRLIAESLLPLVLAEDARVDVDRR